ncbi:molybdopterin converting factor subunit 1 [Aurantivibrio plasticivorans]
MQVKILFFAHFRETLDCDEITIDLSDHSPTVDDVINELTLKGDNWADILGQEQLLIAVNHAVSTRAQILSDGDEVAFFPPVTGG